MPKIAVVVPSIRDTQMVQFRKAWDHLFQKHGVTLITVWDGERPQVETKDYETGLTTFWSEILDTPPWRDNRQLFCRYTDACRNIGFVYAASMKRFDYVLTLDDDVAPPDETWGWHGITTDYDPIEEHLRVLSLKVPLGWMNTAHGESPYLCGFPYSLRDEAPVMLSHGVWVGVPDFDGETQLRLEGSGGLPPSLPYYVGPIPRGVLFPLCGMNVMVKAEALPYFYFAPMGPDTGTKAQCPNPKCGKPHKGYVEETRDDGAYRHVLCHSCKGTGEWCPLNRFADIWMGVFLKREFDKLGWACYTGGATVHHTRASDARKNVEQEKLGREWTEKMAVTDRELLHKVPVTERTPVSLEYVKYFTKYHEQRSQYANLIREVSR